MSNTKLVLTKSEKDILKLLAKGLTYSEVSTTLIINGKSPNSISYIEKLVRNLKKSYRAKTFFQLGVVLSRNGVIK